MAYIGKTPASAALTSSDISDGIISTAKIADDAATAAKIANSVNSAITANTSKTTNATHSGEVTGSGALTIADNVVDEANLKVSNSAVNGYVLTARSGNNGQMTWEEAGGGAYVKLQTITLSGNASTVEFNTNNFTSTYRDYKMLFSNVDITQDGDLYMRIGEAGQNPLDASNYKYAARGFDSNGDLTTSASNGDSKFVINPANLGADTDGRYSNNFEVNIYNPLDTGSYLAYSGTGMMNNQYDRPTAIISAGQYANDYGKQFKRFQFYFASGGDWAGTGGTITLLGRAN